MLTGFLDLLFPPLCSTCNTVLVQEEQHVCLTCSLDLFSSNKVIVDEELIRQRFANASLTKKIVCYSRYEKGNKTQKLIYKLKYDKKEELGYLIGRQLGHYLKTNENWAKDSLLVPIPMHRSKLEQRGFNQASAIAKGVQSITDWEINEDEILTRQQKGKRSQSKNNRVKRFDAMQELYEAHRIDILIQRPLVLVDDVLTTGATLSKCCELLADKGYCNVSVLTFAHA